MYNRLFMEEHKPKVVASGRVAIAVAKYPASTGFQSVVGYESVVVEIMAHDLTSAITLQVQQDTSATQTAGIKNLTGAVVTVPADGDDKIYTIEFQVNELDINNGYKYITIDASGAAGSDDYLTIQIILRNPTKMPVTQDASVAQMVNVVG
jgi:hypothetical protein